MAKKKKKRRGIRTYTPHSFITIIYPLLGFLVIALVCAFLFLPMFSFVKEGEYAITFSGLDFLRLCLKKFLPFLAIPAHETFEYYFTVANPTNELLKIIMQFRDYIYLGIVAFFALGFLFAIIQLIFVVLWFVFGKSEKPTLLSDFSLLTSGFFLFGVGLAYMLCFFYYWIIESTGDFVDIQFSLILIIEVVAIFLFTAGIYGLYHRFFKERVALEKKNKTDEAHKTTIMDTAEASMIPPASEATPSSSMEQSISQEQSQQVEEKPVEEKPAESKPIAPLPVYNEKKGESHLAQEPPVPKGKAAVIKVGDTAYAKSKDIVEAVVPHGIHSLGSSAFADCHELTSVTIPSSVIDIGFNCFMNTPKLTNIVYEGSVERWKKITRGNNWLRKSGTKTVHCIDGEVNVDPRH